jgi:hypothetical protein
MSDKEKPDLARDGYGPGTPKGPHILDDNDPIVRAQIEAAKRQEQDAETARRDAETRARKAREADIVTDFDEDVEPIEDRPSELVFVDEWNKSCWIRAMDREQRDALERDFMKSNAETGETDVERMGFATAVVALCWVKGGPGTPENDERVIVGEKQRAKLQKKNAEAVFRLYEPAARMSGLRTSDREKIKGNSEGDRGTTSSPPSPSTGSAAPLTSSNAA